MFLALPFRDDTPPRQIPALTYGLVAACAAVFLWQISLGRDGVDETSLSLGMIPAVLFGTARLPPHLRLVAPWMTIFTSMFLHSGWLHLIGNMVYLWVFGKGVENALGSARFLVFYFVCGAAAAATQALTDPTSTLPMVGASGAIAGVLGAYLVLYPFGHVFVFFWIIIIFRIVAVPAIILLGLWFLIQLLSAQDAGAGAGVAFWAHVGGFVAGMILVPFMRQRGVGMLQASRTQSFNISNPRDARWRGSGSVPSAGRPWRGGRD
ncbi:MAG TPA: rhomboid family intramembrane serine protease [Stellaceae bacterium]|jgi:membrane associated rhomboid family serine protease